MEVKRVDDTSINDMMKKVYKAIYYPGNCYMPKKTYAKRPT